MKAFLMARDQDFDLEAGLPPRAASVIQDLELEVLFAAMAGGDRFLGAVARAAVLTSLGDPAAIRYRQAVLADCRARAAVVRELYAVAVEAIEGEKHVWGGLSLSAHTVLRRSVNVLELFVGSLRHLRQIADVEGAGFSSEGFRRFFAMIATELDDPYLARIVDHLERVRFRDGVTVSAELGPGNRGWRYVLRRPRRRRRSWRERLGLGDGSSYVYQVPDRDEAGFAALSALEDRGIGLAADALGRSTEHILDFFRQLRIELAFYLACLNLLARLDEAGEPTCVPEPTAAGRPTLVARGLIDPCLSLIGTGRLVGNDIDAEAASLLMITGANRGGKSTLLRSLGLAQLMMQCGMFVAAASFRADVRRGVFSHFKREEDATLRRGKLDEELARMSDIVDHLGSDGLILLNESFASTNEREGSEIARQIVTALLERGVKVAFVTHLYDLADGFYREGRPDALFLRAGREPD
ncbi:MAG: MutS-related protein, partial [Candidatus Limnocylindrales bacterium]